MLPDRFVSKLDVGLCWEWQGGIQNKGYGVFWWEGSMRYAHRLAWTWLVGAIPAELMLDHLCRNRRCCNPDHLEPVTNAENGRRGQTGRWARSPVCRHGHDTSITGRDPNGMCSECRLLAVRRRRALAAAT